MSDTYHKTDGRRKPEDGGEEDFSEFFGNLLAVVGIDPENIPYYWAHEMGTARVKSWTTELGLSHDSIIEVAMHAQARATDIPNGPKAFDAAMRRAAAAQSTPPIGDATPESVRLWHMDAVAVVARAMNLGADAPEDFFFGRRADEMLERGLVTETVLHSYRTGAYMARKAIYGTKAAEAWRLDMVGRRIAREDERVRCTQEAAMRILSENGYGPDRFRTLTDEFHPSHAHWSEYTPKDDPAWQQLNAARDGNEIVRQTRADALKPRRNTK